MSCELNEDHVIMRNNFDSFLNALLVFSISYVLDVFILVYALISFEIDLITKYGDIVIFILPTIFVIISICRNRILKYLVNNLNYKKIYRLFYGLEIRLFAFITFLGVVFLFNSYIEIWLVTTDIILYSLMLISMILFFTFMNSISKTGYYIIEFKQYHDNDGKIIEQQKWLKKICKNIEYMFDKFGASVSKDELYYKINLIKLQGGKIDINDLEKWFTSVEKDNTILEKLKSVVPDVKIHQKKSEPWHEYIRKIPVDQLKFILLIIVLVMIVLTNPDLSLIFSKIMS